MYAIVSPYNRSETTQAAIRLAQFLYKKKQEVRFISLGSHEHGIHDFWSRSLVYRAKSADHALYRLTQLRPTVVFHFDVRPDLVDGMSRTGSVWSNMLITTPHDLDVAARVRLGFFDRIIVPSQIAYSHLQSRLPEDISERLSFCYWTAGIAPHCRDGLREDKVINACVFAEKSAIELIPQVVVESTQCLLKMLPALKITLLSNRSWSRELRRRWRAVQAVSDGRLQMKTCRNTSERLAVFSAVDCVIFPAVRWRYGIWAYQALAYGAPVFGFQVSPIGEVLFSSQSVLVPSQAVINRSGATTAIAEVYSLVQGCEAVLRDRRKLIEMQANDWQLVGADTCFDAYWSEMLDIS